MRLSKSVPVYLWEEASLPVKTSLSVVVSTSKRLVVALVVAYRLIGDIMYLWNQFDEKITHDGRKFFTKGSSGDGC